MKHFHYEVHGYQETYFQKETGKNTGIIDFAVIEVLALSEKEARSKAKLMLKKKHYRIGRVYECHYSEYDPMEAKEMEVLKMEQRNQMLKEIKKITS